MLFSCNQRKFIVFVVLVIPIYVLTQFFWVSEPAQPKQQIVIERPSLCRTSTVFRCEHCIPERLPTSPVNPDIEEGPSETWAFRDRDVRNYRLTDAQCDLAFPGLFEDINTSVERRRTKPITKELMARADLPKATLRVMIYDHDLYVINHTRPEDRGVRHMATLHALHRAILTSPTPLPNVEFVITVDDFADDPGQLIWSYTRTADDADTWLMPDFGFWSYGEGNTLAALGSWAQVRERMRKTEEDYSLFSSKIPKAFWRGEPVLAEQLRTDLLKRTDMQPWADVRPLQLYFGDAEKSRKDALPIHESCKFMFLIHTEGNSYSGRLKYLQNCRSVIFAHTMEWIQPFEYLMVSSGPKQNYVEVARDFSDLAEKVEYYRAHLEEAERIANNSIATFRDRYNTPAAEACYWRKLIRGWREVSFEPEFYDGNKHWRGTPFENYAFRGQLD